MTTRTPRNEWVYAMAYGRYGCIKIGVSSDPRRRESQHPGVLLAMIPGDRDCKLAVHSQFRDWHLECGVFVPAVEVLRWVESLPIQLSPYPTELTRFFPVRIAATDPDDAA